MTGCELYCIYIADVGLFFARPDHGPLYTMMRPAAAAVASAR